MGIFGKVKGTEEIKVFTKVIFYRVTLDICYYDKEGKSVDIGREFFFKTEEGAKEFVHLIKEAGTKTSTEFSVELSGQSFYFNLPPACELIFIDCSYDISRERKEDEE